MKAEKRENYSALSDETLASYSRDGDDAAFNVLAARYLNTKYTDTSAAYLDRDDFVQESMFGFLNAVRTYDENKGVPFKSYAGVCMRNSVTNAVVGVSDDISVDSSSEIFENIEGDQDPLKYVLSGERLKEVLEACDTGLSRVEKTVIILKAIGMTYKEIGDKIGMEPKAVDNAVQRARKKLKSVLDG